MLHALADGIDGRIVGQHRIVDQHAAIAGQAGRPGELDIRPHADGHHHQIGRQLAAVGKADAGDVSFPAQVRSRRRPS